PKVCSRVPWQSHYAFPLRPPPTPSLFPYTTLFRSDLEAGRIRGHQEATDALCVPLLATVAGIGQHVAGHMEPRGPHLFTVDQPADRKSTRLNSSHVKISYAVFCLKERKANSPASAA